MTDTPKETAPFGFRAVAEAEKQGLVNQVFSKVAERYDQMNDLMSGGMHRLWKDDFVTLLSPPRGAQGFSVIDVAGGTGDIAFRIARAGGAGTSITIADISPEMVAEGAKRADQEGLSGQCRFTVGNAEALAFPDKSFDAYTIAFGIRNVTHIDKALKEAHRVLKPGGRFIILGPNIRFAYREYWDFYDHHLPLSDRSLSEGLVAAGFSIERAIPQFLPFTMAGKTPAHPLLIRAYLALPLAWKILGKQFLIVARR